MSKVLEFIIMPLTFIRNIHYTRMIIASYDSMCLWLWPYLGLTASLRLRIKSDKRDIKICLILSFKICHTLQNKYTFLALIHFHNNRFYLERFQFDYFVFLIFLYYYILGSYRKLFNIQHFYPKLYNWSYNMWNIS